MTNYASITPRDAKLCTEFGEMIARKWFGDKLVDSLPTYSRGPRKGKIKGLVTWNKVNRGGWVRGGYDGGYAENRVGQCIDRRLNKLESSRYGDCAGELVLDLDQHLFNILNLERNIEASTQHVAEEEAELQSSLAALDDANISPEVHAIVTRQYLGFIAAHKKDVENFTAYLERLKELGVPEKTEA